MRFTRFAGLAVALAFGLSAAVAGAAPKSKGVLTVEVLDVGQGDSVLIRSPDGKVALVDGGPKDNLADKLRERGVEQIDLMICSHHHADHYGGLDVVVQEFPPRFYLASNSRHATTAYQKLLTLVRDSRATALFPQDKPRTLKLGADVTLTVFPQPPEDRQNENDNSVGLRLQYGEFSMLLTGDSETAERRWWLANCPELVSRVTILKLAHHGSRNGTDAAWLDTAAPSLAVVSLGAGNSYGHPHAAPLGLLERRGIPLARTDRMGTITIATDGKRSLVNGRAIADRGPLAKGKGRGATKPKAVAPERDEVVVETAAESAEPAVEAAAEQPAKPKVNVNKATLEELEGLPGIGKVLSQRILDGRPYKSVEDLDNVPGIGPKKLEALKPLVSVE